MQAAVGTEGTFNLESNCITLRNARPVVNGVVLTDFQVEPFLGDGVEGNGGLLKLRYTAPALNGAEFIVQVECQDASNNCAYLRCSLQNCNWPDQLDSFGLCFEQVENLRSYLINGYHSWDGTYYVDVEGLNVFGPDEPRPELGYAMTQLLPRYGQGSVVLGFDRHERFQQTFHFDTRTSPPALTILTHWDRRDPDPAQPGVCASERLALIESEGIEPALKAWARLAAQESVLSPRLSASPITGWCSWYNLYSYISEEIILDHLRAAKEVVRRDHLPMHVFQIDDGFTPEMGDWLEVKPQFPRGMKFIMDEIRAAGFVPGLWIAPYLVGNRSKLYRQHPDWVLHERKTGRPLAIMKMYGEYRWHKRSEEYYCLDASHPEAFDYIRQVLRVWRREWGCEYFKTDFMFYGGHFSPEEVVYHTPGMTRIEIWRRMAEMIREEIGEDGIWLGCGCPLWATIGLVDGIRIGGDVGVSWSGGLSAESLLRDQTTRNFANHILWQIDPDCILLRDDYHYLSDMEVRSLALFAGMSGGVTITSDKLDELSAERLRLWRLILPTHRATCEHPYLGKAALTYELVPDSKGPGLMRRQPRSTEPALVQVRRAEEDGGMAAVFVLNTGSYPVQRTYPLVELGFDSPQHVFDWTAQHGWEQPVSSLSLKLQPHEGILLFLCPTPILESPLTLP